MTNEDAIKILEKHHMWTGEPQELVDVRVENKALEMAIKALEQQPMKGKWIHWTDDFKDYVTCSCCDYGEEGEVLLKDKTPFCPICGADMRGDTE